MKPHNSFPKGMTKASLKPRLAATERTGSRQENIAPNSIIFPTGWSIEYDNRIVLAIYQIKYKGTPPPSHPQQTALHVLYYHYLALKKDKDLTQSSLPL